MTLQDRLRAAIDEHGPIPFAVFMEAALYDPDEGYYSGRTERAGNEWITSPTLTPLFGRTLARGLLPILRTVGAEGDEPALVEFGVGGGHLLADVVLGLHELDPDLVADLRVVAVESNEAWLPRLQERFESAGVLDVEYATEGPTGVSGVVVSNELIDALPAHVLEWRGDEWGERRVDWDGDAARFVWTDGDVADRRVLEAVALARAFPRKGQRVEASVEAMEFVRGAGANLDRGALVTIDYGDTGQALWDAHPDGTLHGYHEGMRTQDVLANPGHVDITRLVPFTALGHAGGQAGLRPAGYCTQGELLLGLGIEELVSDGMEALAVKKLVHPDGAGGTFKCLLQIKDVAPPDGWPGLGRRP